MNKFFATYEHSPNEILVFNSEQERNQWVDCKDHASVLNSTEDHERIAITYEEAKLMIGDIVDDEKRYTPHELLDNVSVAIMSVSNEIRMLMRWALFVSRIMSNTV